jgi:hypothetical protein
VLNFFDLAVEITRYQLRQSLADTCRAFTNHRSRIPHPLDKKKYLRHTWLMRKTGVFFSAAFCLCAVLVSCEQVSLSDFLNDHTIPAALRSIEVVTNENVQGGGD